VQERKRIQDYGMFALAYRLVAEWAFSLAWEHSNLARGSALPFSDDICKTSTFLASVSFSFWVGCSVIDRPGLSLHLWATPPATTKAYEESSPVNRGMRLCFFRVASPMAGVLSA
jgi:hypothetical protein